VNDEMTISEIHYIARRLRERALESRAGIPASVEPPLDPAELVALKQLRENGTSRVSEIAQRGAFAQSRISWAIARLRKRGWVRTEPDPSDGRSTRVTLSAKLASYVDAALNAQASTVLDSILRGASARERSAVERGLDILLRYLRSSDAPDTD
jgi:DNA-binding MarR family transcriptional regulator